MTAEIETRGASNSQKAITTLNHYLNQCWLINGEVFVIHMRTIRQEMSTPNMSMKMTNLKLQPLPPKSQWVQSQRLSPGSPLNPLKTKTKSYVGKCVTRLGHLNQSVFSINLCNANKMFRNIENWYRTSYIFTRNWHSIIILVWNVPSIKKITSLHINLYDVSTKYSWILAVKVMADFFRHKNQHDALIQFAQFLVDLWNVC